MTRRLAQALALAVAYFVTGKLGLMLAIPPGYATAVWPPSGIALVGTLVFGYRVWPGILLGSFFVNVGTSFDASSAASALRSLSLAAGIGTGAALQAVAGAFLIRRFVGYPTALAQERDVVRFLCLGGPVGCLINATWSVTGLSLAGVIPWANYLFSWCTWWVGDTIGVLTVTPLALIWVGEPRQVWRQRRRSVGATLGLTFAVVVVFFVLASGWEETRIEHGFEQRADQLAQAVERDLESQAEVLHSIESLHAAVYPSIDRRAFERFAPRLLARHPGILAVSLNIRVSDSLRAAYEEAARRDGYPGFQITEQTVPGEVRRAAQRPEYVPVYYLAPYTGNERALGFDVASDSIRAEALRRARDEGRPIATRRLTLIQETGGEFGVVVFLPIYKHGLPHATLAERRRSLEGYVAGVFRIDDMVESSLKGLDRAGIETRFYDQTAPPAERLLYARRTGAPAATALALDDSGHTSAGFERASSFAFAGRQWRLQSRAMPEYLAAHRSWGAWTVLAGGLLFTSLLGAFLLVVTGRTAAVEKLIVVRTAELSRTVATLEAEIAQRERAEVAMRESELRFRSVTESATDAIISADNAGDVIFWNRGAERMFGYAAEDILGRPLTLLMPERFRAAHRRGLERLAAGGEPSLVGKTIELEGLRKNGTEFPLELSLGAWEAGGARCYSTVVRDITERKRADEALRESEERFRLLVQSVKDYGIFMLDPWGHVASWNEGAERIKGYAAEEIIGRHFSVFYPVEDQACGKPQWELEVAAREGRFEDEGWRVRKDGTLFWANGIITALRAAEGKLVGFTKVTRDLTEQKRAEEEIQLLQTLSLAVGEADDLQRALTVVLQQICLHTGWAYGEAWLPTADGTALERRANVHSGDTGLDAFASRSAEFVFRRGEGLPGRAWAARRAVWLRDPAALASLPRAQLAREAGLRAGVAIPVLAASELVAVLGFFMREEQQEDARLVRLISAVAAQLAALIQRKIAEAALTRQAAELARSNAELEQFANVASHDLQEPLRKIQMFGDRLNAKYTDVLGEDGHDYLKRMRNAADRMQVLIRDLLTLSRVTTQGKPFTSVDLTQVVRDVIADLEPRIEQTGGSVTVDDLPIVDADPSQMRQLFQNLIANALKFHKAGAAPAIRISAQPVESAAWRSDGAGAEATAYCVSVQDNGIGFDEKYLDRIFAPFQRLHGRGEYEGSGMGLAICRRIAERHHGGITAMSVPGGGSTFLVTLLVTQGAEVAHVR